MNEINSSPSFFQRIRYKADGQPRFGLKREYHIDPTLPLDRVLADFLTTNKRIVLNQELVDTFDALLEPMVQKSDTEFNTLMEYKIPNDHRTLRQRLLAVLDKIIYIKFSLTRDVESSD